MKVAVPVASTTQNADDALIDEPEADYVDDHI